MAGSDVDVGGPAVGVVAPGSWAQDAASATAASTRNRHQQPCALNAVERHEDGLIGIRFMGEDSNPSAADAGLFTSVLPSQGHPASMLYSPTPRPAAWVAPVEVVFDRGIYLPELDLWLDALRKQDTSVISHAHSDHTARHRRPVLTHGTRLLLGDYLKRSEPVVLDYGEALEADDYTITLHPAGHCLGSAQTLVTHRSTGERLLYTGDLRTQPSPINEPAEPVRCDVLVIESTYGRPDYVFPPQEEAIATAIRVIVQWLEQGALPVVLGWRLGKAQEALHHLLTAGFRVVCEESVYDLVRRYEAGGVVFNGEYRAFDGNIHDDEVLLFPPGRKSREQISEHRPHNRPARYLELTGWAAGAGVKPWGPRPPRRRQPALQRPRRFQRPGGLRPGRPTPAGVHRLRLPRPGRPPAAHGLRRHPPGQGRHGGGPGVSDAAAVSAWMQIVCYPWLLDYEFCYRLWK